jgi:hypothetical protein
MGAASHRLEGSYMRPDPARQLLISGGFRIGVRTGSQGSHENGRGPSRTGVGIVNGEGIASPIYEELLAGLVVLPQHHVLLPLPAAVENTETTVGITRSIGRVIFLPEQKQGQVTMAPQLAFNLNEIGE